MAEGSLATTKMGNQEDCVTRSHEDTKEFRGGNIDLPSSLRVFVASCEIPTNYLRPVDNSPNLPDTTRSRRNQELGHTKARRHEGAGFGRFLTRASPASVRNRRVFACIRSFKFPSGSCAATPHGRSEAESTPYAQWGAPRGWLSKSVTVIRISGYF